MDEFCGSQFWNTNLTWYTDNPYFTPCFERTVLVWTPCAYLWIFSFFECYYMYHSTTRNIPRNNLNNTKMIATFLLILVALTDLWNSTFFFNNNEHINLVDYCSPIIQVFTFLLSGCLLEMSRRRGVRTSGHLFLFWLLLTTCGAPRARTVITGRHQIIEEPMYLTVTFCLHYPLVVLMLVLNCFADAEPESSEYPKVERPCPEQSASFVSRVTFSWFDPMARLGFHKPLEHSDLWGLNREDSAESVVPAFNQHWSRTLRAQCQPKTKSPRSQSPPIISVWSTESSAPDLSKKSELEAQASVLPALCWAFGPIFLFGAFMKLLQDVLSFINPQILKLLMGFVSHDAELWKGLMYAILLFVNATAVSLVSSQYIYKMFIVGLRARTSLISSIYRKALRLSNASRKKCTVGEIVNLMAVDAQRFMDLIQQINMIWSAPLQIILSLYFLWQILGPSVLSGLAVMLVLIPVNMAAVGRVRDLQLRQMKCKDHRVKMMNEILNGIKVLKMYAWEPSFEKKVLEIREAEVKVLKEAACLNASTYFMWSIAPFLVSLASFATFVLSSDDNILDAETAFVSLALFNIMRLPLSFLPLVISSIVQASVSVKRINNFMNLEELDPNAVEHEQIEGDPLVIEHGSFSWGVGDPPVLHDMNLRVRQSALVAVVGSVGAGKSSLVAALLGEMEKTAGRVNTKGSIAYVSQQAWIQNCSLRDNILFGKPYDQESYERVIEACALKSDIDVLPAGDGTEIGEKGINLSGGQKQRVSLARAVYCDRHVYLLDDPLSAVDSHVARHVFQHVIGPGGLLADKTRLLVTHGLTFLPHVDQILVLRGGHVTEAGTYKQLIERREHFADFVEHHLREMGQDDVPLDDLENIKLNLLANLKANDVLPSSENVCVSTNGLRPLLNPPLSKKITTERNIKNVETSFVEVPLKAVGEQLIKKETTETGEVRRSVYSYYLRRIGVCATISTLIFIALNQTFSIATNVWLVQWSEHQTPVNNNLGNGSSVNGSITGNQSYDNNDGDDTELYLGVYGALGLAQAVFVLVPTVMIALSTLSASVCLHAQMLARCLRSPMSFFDTTPLGRIVNRFSKDVDVMDNTLPKNLRTWINCLIAVFSTMLVISFSTPLFAIVIVPIGAVYYVIQRYYVATSRQLNRLESVSRSPVFSHFAETVTGTSTIRAYGVQDRFIKESDEKVNFNQTCYYPSIIASRWLSIRLEAVGSLVLFFSALFAVLARHSLGPATLGLSITYALQITSTLNWLVRMTSDVETNIVSVERIKEYGETPQEAAWVVAATKLPEDWPRDGRVEFRDYQVRYREGLDLVLHGISCNIGAGEKIGIVGRTGCGKTSLTLGLFRVLEAAGGAIYIDGVDIASLGLHRLRSRISVIPQEPVLFSGSLRANLDPFEQHADAEVWRALEHAHLAPFIRTLPEGLCHEVHEGGEGLSVGQRQLVCLARALLRKTKILVLDEATAAVDLSTDQLIQETIRSQFKDSTVLTIAHRINTIMDSDRVLVLDGGRLVESGPPHELLGHAHSIFLGFARDAKIVD